MTTNKRIRAFVLLGDFLKQFRINSFRQNDNKLNDLFYSDFEELIKIAHQHNAWFTEENIRSAIEEISNILDEKALTDWLSAYMPELSDAESKSIAVIMAGNIPMVGFHDLLCVLISGNKLTAKLSSNDNLLLPFVSKVLIAIEPEFAGHIQFTDKKLENIDAVIATGNNNSASYFNYYFSKYPNIIRKNRNAIAVLSGKETKDELMLLGKDVFQYFGLGCRNVSKLFVPRGYKFDTFYESVYEYQNALSNNKYANNYEYNRTVYLMNGEPSLLDNNFLLLKEDVNNSSPIGVLFYEYYDNLIDLNIRLEKEKEQLQCMVSNSAEIKNAIPLGKAQCPSLADYADGIDTMKFLINLKQM
jgi:hypothetical protein